MPSLRSKGWFSPCLHLIQSSGSSRNQKDPEDDNRLYIVADVVSMPEILSLVTMTYGTWHVAFDFIFSYPNQKRQFRSNLHSPVMYKSVHL